ncbi:hypothetical protein EAF00_006314 [Botryotinia globosa]|nr:hypothetical protein EAF00_006314 [Botryotinia globosa]
MRVMIFLSHRRSTITTSNSHNDMAQFPVGSNDVGVAMLDSELVNFRNGLDSALNDLNHLDNAPKDHTLHPRHHEIRADCLSIFGVKEDNTSINIGMLSVLQNAYTNRPYIELIEVRNEPYWHLHDEAITEAWSNKTTAEDSVISPPPPRSHNAKQGHDNEGLHEDGKIYSQRETTLKSQEELVAEVKDIHAGRGHYEARLIEVDVEPLQYLTGMLHTMSQRYHNFFAAVLQDSRAVLKLRRPTSKVAIPTEVWQHSTSSLLGFIGDGLPIPLDSTLSLEFTTLCMVAWECNRFEDLDCSPGDEEEHHELSPCLKERKERAPGRARGIFSSKI